MDHAKGTITTVAGGAGEFEGNSGDDGPARNALLSFPFDVAVAPDDSKVYVSDTAGNPMQRR